jgi:hypothetical protein
MNTKMFRVFTPPPTYNPLMLFGSYVARARVCMRTCALCARDKPMRFIRYEHHEPMNINGLSY